MEAENRYPIKIVARRTQLAPALIRAWEKRYRAVEPTRSPTGRRLYSEADIARLNLLRLATRAGHSIGHIARLSERQLIELTAAAGKPSPPSPAVGPAPAPEDPFRQVDRCLAAVQALDAPGLESCLLRASLHFGAPVLIERIVARLMERIGETWRQGLLRVAHEHMATTVVRHFIGTMLSPPSLNGHSPILVAATPPRQLHELGAMLAAATAAAQGWRVIYLGPDLPMEDVAAAVHQLQARAVAMSLIYPSDDPRLGSEMRRLRQLLPPEVPLLLGGRAAASYRPILMGDGIELLDGLDPLRGRLDYLRTASPGPSEDEFA